MRSWFIKTTGGQIENLQNKESHETSRELRYVGNLFVILCKVTFGGWVMMLRGKDVFLHLHPEFPACLNSSPRSFPSHFVSILDLPYYQGPGALEAKTSGASAKILSPPIRNIL